MSRSCVVIREVIAPYIYLAPVFAKPRPCLDEYVRMLEVVVHALGRQALLINARFRPQHLRCTMTFAPPAPARIPSRFFSLSTERCGDRAGGRDAGPLERSARACGTGSMPSRCSAPNIMPALHEVSPAGTLQRVSPECWCGCVKRHASGELGTANAIRSICMDPH